MWFILAGVAGYFIAKNTCTGCNGHKPAAAASSGATVAAPTASPSGPAKSHTQAPSAVMAALASTQGASVASRSTPSGAVADRYGDIGKRCTSC